MSDENEKSVIAVSQKVIAVSKIMQQNIDFGVIKGCGTKPVLLKAGAEKLLIAFNLFAEVENYEIIDFPDFNREYKVKIKLISRKDLVPVGAGIGSASTLEKKFKRDNPPDIWNTVLKMAKKRALIDAVLTSLGASMLFTQDLVESEEETK